ncbi:MAG: hypothetical protein JWP97_1015 [Labilithrix sp.]|nr:hypothetical protein [Labilithrix sp.]
MSFLLAGVVALGASGAMAAGRWLARRDKTGRDAPPAPGESPAGEGDPAARKGDDAPPARPTAEGAAGHLDGFPCQLGDVIMRLTGEEAWLAGGVVLAEEAPVAVLFVAPDAGHDTAVYARPAPRESLFWMSPLDAGAILVGGEPPTSVEHDGIRFDRQRRLPLRPKRIGVGAPDVGDSLVLAEYASAGAERLLVLRTSTGTSFAYRGVELEPSTYEVIASGRSTLDDP